MGSSSDVVFLGFLFWTDFYRTLIDCEDSTVFLLVGLLMLVVLDVQVPASEVSSVV